MMIGYHEMSGWWMLFGSLSMLLVWGGLIWMTAFMFRSTAAHEPRRHADDMGDAEKLLMHRLAAGELTVDEFHQAMRALRGK